MTQIFLLTGTSSFPDPGNWNPVNTVEVVGPGSSGARYQSCGYVAGYGGSSGGYGKGVNRTDPFPVALNIPAGQMFGQSGNATWCNWADPGGGYSYGNPNRGGVYAGVPKSAAAAVSVPTAGAAGGPTLGYAGALGGNGSSNPGTTYYGGGGAGAGGPHGAGSAGTNSNTTGTPGGGADAGNTMGGISPGGPGPSGTQWDASHGCGGGGGGSSGGNNAGGVGGSYGGGGGGCGNLSTAQPKGGDGLIILNYTPLLAPPPTNAFIMA